MNCGLSWAGFGMRIGILCIYKTFACRPAQKTMTETNVWQMVVHLSLQFSQNHSPLIQQSWIITLFQNSGHSFTSFSLCNESFSLDEELVDLVWGFGGLMSRSPFRGWPCQSNVCAFMSSSVWLNYSVVCIHSLISRLLKECPLCWL